MFLLDPRESGLNLDLFVEKLDHNRSHLYLTLQDAVRKTCTINIRASNEIKGSKAKG